MKKFALRCFLPVVWLSLSSLISLPAHAQLYLYGVDLDENDFIRINVHAVGTPVIEDLGSPIPASLEIESMAWDPATDSIFVTVDDGTLRRMKKTDLVSGNPVPLDIIGPLLKNGAGSPIPDIESLAVHPVTGILYGVDNDAKKLVSIDKATGVVTYISPALQPNLTGISGIAFTITDPATLFGVKRKDGLNRLVIIDIGGGTAALVHPTNTIGSTNSILDSGKIKALAYSTDGVLYGFHENEEDVFVTINTTTGIGEVLTTVDPGSSNRNIEGLTFLLPDDLIPVELTEFIARTAAGKIMLAWTTQSETENFGFHIYRSTNREVGYARLNRQIIPGRGTTGDAHRYEFEDVAVEAGVMYYYRLADQDFNGVLTFHGPVSGQAGLQPGAFRLTQNFPNPFILSSPDARTSITYTLRTTQQVRLEIFNILGQKVREIVNAQQPAGDYAVYWNGTDANGRRVNTGIFIYRLQTEAFTETRKLLVAD